MRLILVFLLGAYELAVAGASLESIGHSSFEVEWHPPTNHWPDKLWVYEVIPQDFSPTVISNLLVLGGFTERDRTKVPEYIKTKDKKAVFYGNIEGNAKHLAICPTLGYIDYLDPKAAASSQLDKIEGVPDEREATQLGLKCLRMLAVDVSQIATKSDTCDFDLRWEKGTITYVDQATRNEITLTNNYGVFFNRRIDGVSVGGTGLWGGARILFGNNAKVACLQLCWRNLKPHELHNCLSPKQVAEQIKNGRIMLRHFGTNATYATKALRKLTITKATPLYDGKYQDEPMDYVRPYAAFEGTAYDGKSTVGVWFECPSLIATK